MISSSEKVLNHMKELEKKGQHDEIITFGTQHLSSADFFNIKAEMLCAMSDAALSLGHFSYAKIFAELAEKLNSNYLASYQAWALCLQSSAQLKNKNFDEAIRLSELAIKACSRGVEQTLEAKVLCNKLTIYTEIGKEPDSELLQRLLTIHQKLHDQSEGASIVICLANLYLKKSPPLFSLVNGYLRQVPKKISDNDSKVSAEYFLAVGRMAFAEKKFENAKQSFVRAKDIATRLNLSECIKRIDFELAKLSPYNIQNVARSAQTILFQYRWPAVVLVAAVVACHVSRKSANK